MNDEPAELREPDFAAYREGATAGVAYRLDYWYLRFGGCKSNTTLLVTGIAPAVVEVGLPAGRRVEFVPERCEFVADGTAEQLLKRMLAMIQMSLTAHISLPLFLGALPLRNRFKFSAGQESGWLAKPGLGLKWEVQQSITPQGE